MLIFDSNNIAHIAKHSRGDLSFNGYSTGVIFGFLEDVKKLVLKFRENNEPIVFCWDSKKSIRRELLFPQYKTHRIAKERTPEEKDFDHRCFLQFQDLREWILPDLGFRNVFNQIGYESDDLIARLVIDYTEEQNLIISTDDDLLQLLPFANVYNPITKNVMDRKRFVEVYGIQPEWWVDVKCLAGCMGDNVPNIPGVQVKTAIKYLKGEIKNKKSKTYLTIKQEEEKYARQNRVLVELPLRGTKPMTIQKDEYNLQNFIKICDRFGFQSFTKDLTPWRKLFQ